MTRLYIRHVSAVVALTAVLMPHWLPALRSPGEGPLHYTLVLTVAALLVAVVSLRARTREAQPGRDRTLIEQRPPTSRGPTALPQGLEC